MFFTCNIPETVLEGGVIGHGPGDILVDAGEEHVGVSLALDQEVGVVAWVL